MTTPSLSPDAMQAIEHYLALADAWATCTRELDLFGGRAEQIHLFCRQARCEGDPALAHLKRTELPAAEGWPTLDAITAVARTYRQLRQATTEAYEAVPESARRGLRQPEHILY